jgi:predicted HTH domain antitoxin
MPRCKICKEPYTRTRLIQPVCDKHECKLAFGIKVAEKLKQRKIRAEKTILREKIKTLSDYQKDLQLVFNKFIRLRDINLKCVSCDKPYDGNFHASHYFSVGHFPHLRFNELNVHGACVECNVHKHGNTAEYSINLPKRIGLDNYNKLLNQRIVKHKYTRSELQDLIKHYKEKIKELKQKQ